MKKKSQFGVEVKNSNSLPGGNTSNVINTKMKKIIKSMEKSFVVYLKSNDPFKNKENFMKGIQYITENSTSKVVNGCCHLLDYMVQCCKVDEEVLPTYLSFFCEVGVWKDEEVRQDCLYDEDFSKYLLNCKKTWFSDMFDNLFE